MIYIFSKNLIDLKKMAKPAQPASVKISESIFIDFKLLIEYSKNGRR